jgi:hypothetical protein
MTFGAIFLATTFSFTLILATLSEGYVFAQPNEMESSSNMTTGAMQNAAQEAPDGYHPRGNASLPPPEVIFPTPLELDNYFRDKNATAPTFISNGTLGNTTDIQQASSNGTTYVVFQTKLNGTDHVYLTIIRDAGITPGASFSEPVELTPAQHGDISHLQIAADLDKAYTVWQDYNSTNGLSNIFVSSSMDSGNMFRTYRANNNNVSSFDPSISPNGVVTWRAPCPTPGGGGGGGPPDDQVLALESGSFPVPPSCPMYYVKW